MFNKSQTKALAKLNKVSENEFKHRRNLHRTVIHYGTIARFICRSK